MQTEMKRFISAVYLLCKYAAIASNQLQSINKTFCTSQDSVSLSAAEAASNEKGNLWSSS